MDDIIFNDKHHHIGDKRCRACYDSITDPKDCECGGLIHTHFQDEDEEGNYWITYKCDKCGKTEW